MNILPPSDKVIRYLKARGLLRKYERQVALLSQNIRHPSLRTERLEPKAFVPKEAAIKIIDANDHYQ